MESNELLFIGGLGGWEVFFLLIFFVLPAILWIWALTDLLKGRFTDNTNKLIWALVIIFIPVIGAILYLIIGKNQKVP